MIRKLFAALEILIGLPLLLLWLRHERRARRRIIHVEPVRVRCEGGMLKGKG